jgi:histidinol-phosphate/aromatic aminotransferase/cobyric acid decarboxylase-like protein
LIRPLFKHINASQIHHQLQQLNIFVKNTSNAHELLANTLRITVSHAQENHAFIVGLKKVL